MEGSYSPNKMFQQYLVEPFPDDAHEPFPKLPLSPHPKVTEESIESSQRDSLISPSLSMGPSPSFDQFGGPSPSFDQFGGPSPSFEQFGGPSTSSFSSQQSSFGLPGSPHPLSNQQYSDASSVASQPSLFPEDYSPYQQESYSSHSYSPQPAMFPSESSNYQDIHYSSSGLQGQEDYLSLQQYPSSAEDPLGETGAYGLMPQQAGPSHLLNKKNEPRQRQPKKSRHSCTPQEYEEYQREQSRLRQQKKRNKDKLLK